MSKKQKRRKARSGGGQQEVATSALEARAREALQTLHWRDAIAAYKELLKRESRADWRRGLAEAYAGRAGELAAKGMLKEALAIWENRAALDPAAPMPPDHAALLLRLDRPDAILAVLAADGAARRPPEQLAAIRAQLAARVLGGGRALLERLPEDEPVRRYAEPALAALAAYCERDDASLHASLAAMPFRSPYRDWVQILKALLRRAEAPAEAQSLLERVEEASPFAPLKRAALLSLLPETAFLGAAADAGPNAVRMACVLRGWPPQRIALWEALQQLGSQPSATALVRLLQRHAQALGKDWVRRKVLNLAVHAHGDDPEGWLTEVGGVHPDGFEQALLDAWTTDPNEEPWEALACWQRCAELLEQRLRASRTPDPELALRIALLLRRADADADILASFGVDFDDCDGVAAQQLEASLAWDPDDRATYLRLIHYYRRTGQRKDARRLLDQAQSRWPQDMGLLEAAMDIALDAGSFKKAAGVARQILDIDPINSGVRGRLVSAHLAHARKQVAKARTDLARKELATAQDWARDEQLRRRLALSTALLAVMDGDKAGIDALREQIHEQTQQGAGLAERLELMLAADALDVRPATVNRRLQLKQPQVRDGDDLTATLARLRAGLDTDHTPSQASAQALDAPLMKAPWRVLSRTELETGCDTLARCGLNKARQQAATAALQRWPGEPIFELHRFEAKYPRGFDYRSMKDLWKLEQALARARDRGDMRTALRIEEAMPGMSFGGGFGGGPPSVPPMPFPVERDAAETGAVPPHIITLIRMIGLKKALEILGAPPEIIRQVQEVERELGADAAVELLVDLLNGGGDFDPFVNSPPPPRRGRRRGRRRDDAAADHDDDEPDQLTLF